MPRTLAPHLSPGEALLALTSLRLHALTQARLGWLDLDTSSAESPATEDLGLLMIWAAPDATPQSPLAAAAVQGPLLGSPPVVSPLLASPLLPSPSVASPSLSSSLSLDLEDSAYRPSLVLALPLPSPSFDDLRGLGVVETIAAYTLVACAMLPLASLLLLLLVLPWTPPDVEPDRWLQARRLARGTPEEAPRAQSLTATQPWPYP